ncbi:MAG: trypsin-like peptidase domain-containing protein [Bacteroidales bacterium]|nr:trypsin-like peptidase domain-containing protein [Bacteroidales bacterium]
MLSKRIYGAVLLTVLFAYFLYSCNPKMGGVVIQPPQLSDKKGSLNEGERIAEGLERLSASVYRVTVIAFYDVYTLSGDVPVYRDQLSQMKLKRTAIAHDVIHRTVLGTAIPVYYDENTAGFLTCAHVVTFPDTAVSYYDTNVNSSGKKAIKSIAVKLRQQNYISDLLGENVTVVAIDRDHDIAFLKMNIKPDDPHPVLFPFLPGNSASLNWGEKLYILGFPQGKKMVTSALYSKPVSSKFAFFLMDAVLNRGFSGAPVVVYNNQPPYFKWVGMASSIASQDMTYLVPDFSEQATYNTSELYQGPIKVNKAKMISYGISYSLSMEQIRRFVQENKEALAQNGIGPIDW